MKNALYNADIFIAKNRKPTHRDSRRNTIDIIDYIIPSPAIYNTLNNDLSCAHSVILFDFSINISKSIPIPIKVKLYHKTDWEFINSSLPKQLAILKDQILNLIPSNNSDPINIINNASTILSDSIMSIHSNVPEKLLNQTPAYYSLFS